MSCRILLFCAGFAYLPKGAGLDVAGILPRMGVMTREEAVHTLWEYHRLHQRLHRADLIFVLGSNDPRVAVRAAQLYHEGLAPRILFSGGRGRFTENDTLSEAERFARVAVAKGVPEESILLEPESTNTGENIRFSRRVLEGAGLAVGRVLAVQKPYMERRTLASLEAQWPEVAVQVTSPSMSFEEYLTAELTEEFVINAMVGDFQRIVEYPKRGFASVQPIPLEAREAFETLVRAGYGTQLLS